MKKWLKNWLFSILCYIIAIGLLIYIIVVMWIDYEVFFKTTQLISSLSPILLLIIIGIANQPKKGN